MKHFTLLAVICLLSWQSNSQITTYPYVEDFELGAGGWTVTGGLWALGTPAATVINSASSGVNSWATNLTGTYAANSDAAVTSPVFDFTAVPNPFLQASVWWNSEFSWDGAVLQSSTDGGATWQNVGAFGDPGNWFTDNTINGNPGGQSEGWTGRNSSGNGSGGWVNASHDLTGLGGLASVTLRVSFGSDGSVQDDGFAFDDVNIVNLTCPQPTALTATSILDVSADLVYTEAGTATTWNLEWGPAGFTPGSGTMVMGAANPYPLTGLTALTSYSYYVQSDCGGGDLSFWSGPFTFTTACSIFTPDWIDDVEAHATSTGFTGSNCWTASAGSGYDWNITGTGTTGSSNTGATSANSGSKYFYTEASGAAVGATCTLTSPVLDASAMTFPTLKFWYHMHGNQMGDLAVEAWDGSTWNQVALLSGEQQSAQGDGFIEESIYLVGYNIFGLQVRFIATSGGSFEGDICIDDVSVTEAPSCPAPDPFGIVSSDLTSANLDWTLTPISSETEWELEWGTIGFTPGGSGTSLITSNNPETISGLAPNSFYEVYLQSVCGVGDSSTLVGPLLINTYDQGQYMQWDNSCAATYTDISLTGTPLDLLYAGEMDFALPFDFLYQGSLIQNIAFTSSGYIMLEAAPGQFSATFNQTINNAIYWGLFPFWEAIEADFGNQYYQTTGTAPNQKFIVQWDDNNYLNGPNGELVSFQLQIDQATGEIDFLYEDVIFGGSDVAFDNGASATVGVNGPNQNLQVSYNDAAYLQDNSCAHFYYTDCPVPTNYSVTYTTTDEGAITWGSGLSGETNWTVIYGPAGFDPAQTGTSVSTSTPVLIMPGLNDITTYDVYIYAECGPGLTSNGYMGSFTTLPNCADPTGIAAASAVDTLFSVWSWTENVGYPSTGFGVDYGWTGYAGGTGTTVWVDNNFTDTTADNSLIGGGVYEVYIQAVCGTDSSNWVGPVSFTMPLTNDSTCFAEELAVDGTLYTFNNAGATIDANEISIAPPATGFQTQTGWGNSNLNSSVWFTFTAPASGNIRANAAGINFDGQLAAYEVTDCNDFATYTLLGANDDGPNNVNPPLLNLCGLTPGAQYYLMYDPFSTTATGTYNLTLTDVDITAGTDNGLTDICLGDTVNLFTNISGNDAGGVWYENIPTANFSDSIFVSAGLASQEFGFTYVVTDGCAADTIATSVEIYAPSSAGSDGTITACLNQPIDLLDGLGGNVDLGGNWYDPTNTLIASTAINSGPVPGQFNYDYITGNGVCPDDSANIIVDVDFNCDFLNLQDLFFNGMDIHPNPTTGMIYISNDGSTEVFNIELTDLNGKVIATQSGAVNGTETTEVDLSNLETGIYLIHVFNDNAEKTFRVVKQ
jgi:hypothetical protein